MKEINDLADRLELSDRQTQIFTGLFYRNILTIARNRWPDLHESALKLRHLDRQSDLALVEVCLSVLRIIGPDVWFDADTQRRDFEIIQIVTFDPKTMLH